MYKTQRTHKILALLLLFVVIFTSSPVLAASAIVDAVQIYESKPFSTTVENTLYRIHDAHPETTELKIVGKSVDGRSIPAVKIGRGDIEILVFGAMHARETMTAVLILDQLEKILLAYEDGRSYEGFNTRQLLDNVSIWFLPLLNPDGAELTMNGTTYINNTDTLFSVVNPNFNFPIWKANLNGVDLNSNYDTDAPQEKKSAGYEGFSGPAPFSEPETKSIMKFCTEHEFKGVISYHSAGEIIYWHSQHHAIAKKLSAATGYSLMPASEEEPNLVNFRAWFDSKYKDSPSFTVEVGRKAIYAPMASSEYARAWQQNKTLPLVLAQAILEKHTNTSPIQQIIDNDGFNYRAIRIGGELYLPARDISQRFNFDYQKLIKDDPYFTLNDRAYMKADTVISRVGIEKFWDGNGTTLILMRTPMTIYVNGEKIEFDQSPIIENDRTLVPFRAVLEAMGAKVGWSAPTRTVTASMDKISLHLEIGSKKLFNGNSIITLDTPARIVNDRTLVPVRAFAEAFDAKVGWDGKTKTVTIDMPEINLPAKESEETSDVRMNVQTGPAKIEQLVPETDTEPRAEMDFDTTSNAEVI